MDFFQAIVRRHNLEVHDLANEALNRGSSVVTSFPTAWASVALMTDVLLEGGFDGTSRGNPGPSAAGFWVRAWRGRCEGYLLKGSLLLGEASNNEAGMSRVCIVMRLLADQLRLACF